MPSSAHWLIGPYDKHERSQTRRLRDALRERNVRNIWASDPESEVDEEEEEGEGDEEVDADEEDDEMLDIVNPAALLLFHLHTAH